MFNAPSQPFLPKHIPMDGGGLDYLGLRWVNLKLLADQLLPGINNATQDVGTYCLATWISWKFRHLCTSDRDFTEENYAQFREAAEVAVSYAMRPGSPANADLGEPHRKIGVRQKYSPPGELSFRNAGRGSSTSIFSAPLYGPSLRYLGLLSDAAAIDLKSSEISIPVDDERVRLIAETLDQSLSLTGAYQKLARLGTVSLSGKDLDELALAGFHPAYFQSVGKKIKRAFLSMLVPGDISNGRTATSRLLVSTANKYPGKTLEEVRAIWHTGLVADEKPFRSATTENESHRRLWAVFQARQFQRYVIELFLRCFEIGLRDGLCSIEDMAIRFHRESGLGKIKMRELFAGEAADISKSSDWLRVASQWNRKVGPSNERYVGSDYWPPPDDNQLCDFAFRRLARWWIPMNEWLQLPTCQDWLALGGEDRIGTKWFHQWVRDRLDQPVKSVLHEILEKLVFAQHVRVALSRFDGESQRLRFALGDRGIVAVTSIEKLTIGIPGWTEDRLGALKNLLSDLSVLRVDNDGKIYPGDLATEVSL